MAEIFNKCLWEEMEEGKEVKKEDRKMGSGQAKIAGTEGVRHFEARLLNKLSAKLFMVSVMMAGFRGRGEV